MLGRCAARVGLRHPRCSGLLIRCHQLRLLRRLFAAAASGTELPLLRLRGSDEAPPLLEQLERLAELRVDPEKLRWRRSLRELSDLRQALSGPQLARLLAALARHPIALDASPVSALVDLAVQRLRECLADLSTTELAAVARALAVANCSAADHRARRRSRRPVGAEDDDGVSIPAPARSAGQEAAALAFFWETLVPRSLESLAAEETVGGEHADVLFALGMAWPSLPVGWDAALAPGLRAVLAAVLEDARRSWRRGAGAASDAPTLARLVAGLGLLEARGAFRAVPPSSLTASAASAQGGDVAETRAAAAALSSGGISERVVRTLGMEPFQKASLPTLVLLHMGLRGLGLAARGSPLGRDVADRLATLLSVPGGSSRASGGVAGAPIGDLCHAVVLLRSCGRLVRDEPLAFELLRACANGVDSLQRGERRVLARALGELAAAVGCRGAGSSGGLAPASVPLPARGSPAAAVCQLAQYDWFSRQHRAQVSWMRQRGAL